MFSQFSSWLADLTALGGQPGLDPQILAWEIDIVPSLHAVSGFRSPLPIFFLPMDSESFADLIYPLVDKQYTTWHLQSEVTLFFF